MISLQQIGRFEIISSLGKGDINKIYLAFDPRLDRKVIIKVFPSVVVERLYETVRYFEESARIIAGLKHPNIPVIYDFGEDREIFYVVMEYAEGRSLDELLRDRTVSRPEFLEILAQVCDSLEIAYQRGLAHREINPKDILVAVECEQLLVKVTDFGAAMMPFEAEDPEVPAPSVSLADYPVPEYIKSYQFDARSNIFRIGTMLYEFLSEKKPFSGATAWALMNCIITEPHTPIDTGSFTDISPNIRAVVDRALEKNPDNRYQTPKELASALRAAKEPVLLHSGYDTVTREDSSAEPPDAVMPPKSLINIHQNDGDTTVISKQKPIDAVEPEAPAAPMVISEQRSHDTIGPDPPTGTIRIPRQKIGVK